MGLLSQVTGQKKLVCNSVQHSRGFCHFTNTTPLLKVVGDYVKKGTPSW